MTNEPVLPEYDDESENSSIEETMIRMAVEQLTPKQKKVWELYNFDRKTEEEIAVVLKMTHQGVHKHIQTIEKSIAKWCKNNMGAYKVLKAQMEFGPKGDESNWSVEKISKGKWTGHGNL